MGLQRFASLQPAAALPQLIAILGARRERAAPTGAEAGWYSIRNVSEVEAEVMIYDEIGAWGVTAADFIRELRDVKAAKLTLRINSPGGDVFDGIAIYNALTRHKAEVTAYIDGIAASAASFIAMAGDKVYMSPHSQMMIHEASGLVMGPASEMLKMAEILNKTSDNIAAIYAERAGGTVEDWRERMCDETWLSDREAVELGLADGIDGMEGLPPKAKPAAGPRNAEWDTQYINDLPDAAFAVILSGGEKDDEGKTVPRQLRKLPHHNSSGAVDEAHLRNALSREPQTDMPEADHAHAKMHLDGHMAGEHHSVDKLATAPAVIDYSKLFDQIVEEAEDLVFATE